MHLPMPDIFSLLNDYLHFFPLVALLGLCLGALNLPVSEDLIIITGALLSYEKPSNLVYNLVAIYIGVISTDYFVYWVGTRVRRGASKSGFLTRFVPEKALEKMHYYMDKYGIFTFIVCRFIPFGVRNTLFFTSGFFRLRLKVFALYEFIAAMISINTLFFLVYNFGDEVKRPLKIAGIIIFVVFVSIIITLIIRFIVTWQKKAGN
jgi:membrane protein DedA with SNARE-associated domain